MVLEASDKQRVIQKANLGPHGVGDPNDKFLRKVELNVLIPKIIREKTRAEKCAKEVADFNKCCKENGFSLVLNCRKENAKMKDCFVHWFYNDELKQQCTEEYLKERTEYRATGLNAKQRSQKQQLVS